MIEFTNPLEELIYTAKVNDALWDLQNENEFSDIQIYDQFLTKLPVDAEIDEFPKENGIIIYPDIETAGIAGLFIEINKLAHCKVIFSNELAYEIRGLDAIAQNSKSHKLLFCEAKGTMRPLKSPISYLRKTKNKGRQLSWEWCWNSLCEFAEFPVTANAFLHVVGPFVRNVDIERLLVITLCFKHKAGYSIDKSVLFYEVDLDHYEWLKQKAIFSDLEKWKSQLDELTL